MCHDPWIDADEAEHEYGIRPIKRVRRRRVRCSGAGGRTQAVPRDGRSARCARPARRITLSTTSSTFSPPTRSMAGCERLRLKILLTGAAGFIGFHTAQQAAGARRRSGRSRQPQRLLRSDAEACAPRHPRARAEVPLREDGSGRQGRHEGAVRAREVSARDPSRGAGRRALLARESAGLHRQQRHRHAQRARGLPAQRRRAPGVRLDQLGLRPQHQHAVLACIAASIIRCRCTPRPSAPTS